MPRVNHVAACRKPQECGSCGKKIKTGEPYKWAKPRYGSKMVRCDACKFRQSDLSSSKMATIWDAQQDFDLDGCESLSDIQEKCSEFAETVREVAQEYQESAQNMEDGMGHRTEMCEELDEKGQSLEAWADECESAADGVDDFDEDAVRDEVKGDDPDLDDDAVEEEVESRRSAWLDEARETVESTISDCPE